MLISCVPMVLPMFFSCGRGMLMGLVGSRMCLLMCPSRVKVFCLANKAKSMVQYQKGGRESRREFANSEICCTYSCSTLFM